MSRKIRAYDGQNAANKHIFKRKSLLHVPENSLRWEGMANLDDKALVEQAKKDRNKFALLYTKYGKIVFMYLWRRLGHDRDTAEDLMQETFLKAFRHLSTFTYRGFSYVSYLIKIAHNLLVNHFRKAKEAPIEEAEELPGATGVQMEARADAREELASFASLKSHERELIAMRYEKDLPVRDIAKMTGKSENAVKLALSRLRRKMKGKEGGVNPEKTTQV